MAVPSRASTASLSCSTEASAGIEIARSFPVTVRSERDSVRAATFAERVAVILDNRIQTLEQHKDDLKSVPQSDV